MSDLNQRVEWVAEGTRAVDRQLDVLADEAFSSPSSLEGWTFGHIVAHVGYNALALCNLLSWASTGVETPMYPSVEARRRQIEEGSTLPPQELRDLVRSSAAELASRMTSMTDAAWGSEVRTAQGRAVAASEVPWMRCREVWVHAVDLEQGLTFADFPPDFVDALVDDIVFQRARRGQSLDLVIAPSDRERTWTIQGGTGTPVRVTGTAAHLCAWLAGRGENDDVVPEGGELPDLSGGWL